MTIATTAAWMSANTMLLPRAPDRDPRTGPIEQRPSSAMVWKDNRRAPGGRLLIYQPRAIATGASGGAASAQQELIGTTETMQQVQARTAAVRTFRNGVLITGVGLLCTLLSFVVAPEPMKTAAGLISIVGIFLALRGSERFRRVNRSI